VNDQKSADVMMCEVTNVDPCDGHMDVGDVGDGARDSVIVNDGMSDDSVIDDDVGCLDHVQVVQHVDSQSQADMAAKSMAPVESIDMVGCQRQEAAKGVHSLAALSHRSVQQDNNDQQFDHLDSAC
jgi:hypothetical protein